MWNPLRNRRWTPTLSLAVLVSAACGGAGDSEPAPDEPAMQAPAPADPVPTADTLLVSDVQAPADAPSGTVGGQVAIFATSSAGTLRLHFRGTGLPVGEHAWHIHQGACGSSGPVVIALSPTEDMEGIAGPLEVPESGNVDIVVQVADLQRDIVGLGQHSLHVHQTGGIDHGPTIACSTL